MHAMCADAQLRGGASLAPGCGDPSARAYSIVTLIIITGTCAQTGCYNPLMRLLLIALVACSSPAKPKPAPPVPVSDIQRGCAEAAAGIEQGTRSIRDPGTSVVSAMRGLCLDDKWVTASIECFAKMTEDELGRCAGTLAKAARDRLFDALGGTGDDRTAIAIAQARLTELKVGVAECDSFVTTVSRALGCEAMPLEQRAQLGNETADFWSLPTANLPEDAARRMASVCGESLTFLRKQVTDAGCMP
jgi:hypothetical protein